MNIALIGISGWGGSVLNAIKALEAEGCLKLLSISDNQYEQNREKIDQLEHAGVSCYRDYKEMLSKQSNLDVVAIATPIHLHKTMSIEAMEAGFHVFLEKPPASTIQDADAIIEASGRTGKLCAVDFLNSSDEAFLELKRCISAGKLGEIRTITGVGLWQRLDSYYSRTGWAGKLTFNGNYVLDGTVVNPLSHLLNNMLLLGLAAPQGGKAEVAAVTAELYHAHDIAGEDTSCLRVEMSNGVLLHFFATLCGDSDETPYLQVQGTKGAAYWDYNQKLTISVDGQTAEKDFSADPQGGEHHDLLLARMIRNLCAVIAGKDNTLYCSVQDTRSFVLAANGAFESSNGTHEIPARFCRRYPSDGSVATDLIGIQDIILGAARQRKLFSELGVEWAVPGKLMNMTDYSTFNMEF
jgi:predicted dehydrogenase